MSLAVLASRPAIISAIELRKSAYGSLEFFTRATPLSMTSLAFSSPLTFRLLPLGWEPEETSELELPAEHKEEELLRFNLLVGEEEEEDGRRSQLECP